MLAKGRHSVKMSARAIGFCLDRLVIYPASAGIRKADLDAMTETYSGTVEAIFATDRVRMATAPALLGALLPSSRVPAAQRDRHRRNYTPFMDKRLQVLRGASFRTECISVYLYSSAVSRARMK
jgi:hypothetical protein